jgi:chemotaxis signal transduction protein
VIGVHSPEAGGARVARAVEALVFQIGPHQIAVAAEEVESVLRQDDAVRLQGEGFEFRWSEVFGSHRGQRSPSSRVLLGRFGETRTALTVDRVDGLMSLEISSLHRLPRLILETISSQSVVGLAQAGNRLLIVVDFPRLLEESLPEA